MTEIKGVGASKGLALGTSFVIQSFSLPREVASQGLDYEKQQLLQGQARVREAINERILASKAKDAVAILQAHLMFLDDPEWLANAEASITAGQSAYNAIKASGEAFALVLEQMDDSYLKERASDIRAVTTQWLEAMLGYQEKPLPQQGPIILVAEDISPGLAAILNPEVIVGIVTQKGGKTSHTAIIANNLGIPAVLGVKEGFELLTDGQYLAMDGSNGVVRIEPSEEMILDIEAQIKVRQEQEALIHEKKFSEGRTQDGHRIEIAANIGSAEEANKAVESGAEGVGLFRTEFVYMEQTSFPSVELQSEIYIDAVRRLGGKTMIFRTFDIGGDKALSYFPIEAELNPFMGYRALRICLNEETLFLTQLKAMLMASSHGPCKIMFPMVSSLEEFRAAKAVVKKAMAELEQQGLSYDKAIPLGIMVEVPSVAAAAQLYAQEVDFFSVGTNDLTQYTLAVDRMNEAIAELYEPFNPGVIHLLANTYKASRAAGIMGGMCGEMAGNLLALPLLVGLGIHELSMSPKKIPGIKAALSKFTKTDAEALAEEVLTLTTAVEIQEKLKAFLDERAIAH